MMRLDEPMTTLDVDEWRAYKRATRNLKYRRRLQESPLEKGRRMVAWLAAVERDDRRDETPEMSPESSNFAEVSA